MKGPILAVDVHYEADRAHVAGIGFDAWTAATSNYEYGFELSPVHPYRPGRFFERELPCVERLLTYVLTSFVPQIIVVDAYVDLGGRPGLGRYVHQIAGGARVVGVAKNAFASAPAIEVFRGTSTRALFVTAAGWSARDAARAVESMHGEYRMPTLLDRVDRLARGA